MKIQFRLFPAQKILRLIHQRPEPINQGAKKWHTIKSIGLWFGFLLQGEQLGSHFFWLKLDMKPELPRATPPFPTVLSLGEGLVALPTDAGRFTESVAIPGDGQHGNLPIGFMPAGEGWGVE